MKRSLRALEEDQTTMDDDYKSCEIPKKKIKRSSTELKEEPFESPKKKMRQNHIDSDVDLDHFREIFAMNTSEFNDRYEVYQHFRNVSLALIRDLVLVIPKENNKKSKLYQFVEFEFYCLDDKHHQDVFAHCDDIQYTSYAS